MGQRSVTQLLEARVEPRIRDQGQLEFRTGRIETQDAGPERLVARARGEGSAGFDVEVGLEGSQFRHHCSCPYHQRGYVCKHVWGALLLAESMRLTRFVTPLGPAPESEVRSAPSTPSSPGDDSSAVERAGRIVRDLQQKLAQLEAELAAGPREIPPPEPETSTFEELEQDLLDMESELVEPVPPAAAQSGWRALLDSSEPEGSVSPTSTHEALFELEGLADLDDDSVRLRLIRRRIRPDGSLGQRSLGWNAPHEAVGEAAREVFEVLRGLPVASGPYAGTSSPEEVRAATSAGAAMAVAPGLHGHILLRAARSGRLVHPGSVPARRISWDPRPIRVQIGMRPERPGDEARTARWRVVATLLREGEELDESRIEGVTAGGVVGVDDELAPLSPHGLASLVRRVRRQEALLIEESEVREFLSHLMQSVDPPDFALPEELRPRVRDEEPRPRLLVRKRGKEQLEGKAGYWYGSTGVDVDDPRPRMVFLEPWETLERDAEAERSARLKLSTALDAVLRSMEATGSVQDGVVRFPADRLPEVTTALDAAGIEVWAHQRRIRSAGRLSVSVKSDLDWFELDGRQDFGEGLSLSLPSLLAALEQKRDLVRLDDGSLGLIPEGWLRRHAAMLGLGEEDGEAVRFGRNQAVWLDHLLSDTEDIEARSDEAFQRVQQGLNTGLEPRPADPSPDFQGTLRPYQSEGLGWQRFLSEVDFGGILADDMGLGKTVQVLAHAQLRRKEATAPALVVAPRSVVHQWVNEAGRFVPEMSVVIHLGPDRSVRSAELAPIDLVVTSYGVLRRDIEMLGEIEWDVLVLDEAQMVKNEQTATARATRVLSARQRLVVTGTPVENHLGELANHLDFLNPGLFGRTSALRQRFSKNLDSDEAARLSRALRPLILRRTKDQVAQDLPPRIEQDLVCVLAGRQKELYDELQAYYAGELLDRAREEGLAKMKIQVLEALLRLRQTACHPALVDPGHAGVPTAKFDVLIPRIEELVREGSKALVFSQFTKYLSLVETELQDRGVKYERLDGRTRDREERVRHFQEDEEISVFLISLKAGGFGLNLTAARYVFLLDPWWNPAVEAQAIDRAHRLGQAQQVMAYRLLAKDTVEDKIRRLQDKKRALAEALLAGDASVLRALSVDDLAVLLGGAAEPSDPLSPL